MRPLLTLAATAAVLLTSACTLPASSRTSGTAAAGRDYEPPPTGSLIPGTGDEDRIHNPHMDPGLGSRHGPGGS